MTNEKNSKDFKISGFREGVVSVLDIDTFEELFCSLGGWEKRYRGVVAAGQLRAWQLPEHVSAEESLIGNLNEPEGQMRLVKFSGDKEFLQTPMRPDAQCWDTGGIHSLSMRVLDLDKIRQLFHAQGWHSFSAPNTYRFADLATDEWVPRGPNGMNCSFCERLTPPLTGWPHLKKISRIFNSSQIVRDIEVSLKFYKEVLCFKEYASHIGPMAEAGPNPLGLPYNMANTEGHSMHIVHPDAVCDGSVEILQFDTFTGADFSEQTHFPNVGTGSLRFPVKNIAALYAHVQQTDATIISPLTTIPTAPYGDCESFIISSPDGAWLELFEALH